jgi:hypothetical protein
MAEEAACTGLLFATINAVPHCGQLNLKYAKNENDMLSRDKLLCLPRSRDKITFSKETNRKVLKQEIIGKK